MTKALEGVRILDMTHVQSGPTCTQLLAWFGADVIKVERPGAGDATRGQLRDIPDVDSLYFTMLNHNKRSVTLNTKHEKGKDIFTRLIKHCDVMVENFAPGAIDRMGFPWERIHEINPRMIYASVKGFGPGPYWCSGWIPNGYRSTDWRFWNRPQFGTGYSYSIISSRKKWAWSASYMFDAGWCA